jgi:hypothetical protein
MAETTVFVDDAVQGLLPPVCAKTGAPATKRLTIHQDLTPGLGAAWLLVFFGPLGWLVLLAIAATRRRSSLTVRVPYSDDMLAVYVAASRRVFRGAAGFGVVFVAILALGLGLSLWPSPATFALAMGTVVIGAVVVAGCSLYARRWLVTVRLDGSGRWVTLAHVHPEFAAACRPADRAPRPAVPQR